MGRSTDLPSKGGEGVGQDAPLGVHGGKMEDRRHSHPYLAGPPSHHEGGGDIVPMG